MKKIFTFVVFLLIFFNTANKAFSIEADAFVQQTVSRAAKTLSSGLTKEERIQKLKEIAKEAVDIRGIGFYSLGSHRKNLTKEQLENYKDVFEAYFLKSFSSRLAEYSNPEIEVNSQKKINKNYTIVSSTLVATNTRPEVKIEWRVYTKDPENLLIRDLIIEGLSLARTQKEEFSSIINSNDGKIEALLKNLSDFSSK
ncbi:ABC transporter substrate-binding protein [Candidatus Pelagibacter sp.]|jgi:phospholipid transport system substrate-binding protein|nr:ABC transporter substrate-binding protein [Candidatus Pelagibacter sp.]MDB9923614.1 ABC transporter substrate-binding protein [Candidatus Pelagibacter sp.]MDC0908367.1 ABC transporter substrate-binding protein [Candidatus Pelagibacter sp.]|tara:strand:- start:510 stop:1103 length:594 start_codon:yes stop_codon:yes gene_type:complete